MNDTPQKTVSRRGFIGRAGAVGAAAAIAPTALAACGDGGSGADAEVVGDADYVQGSSELQVELGEEVDGINYPSEYKGPKARALEPFGDGETEFTMLGRTIPDLDYSTNYYAQHLEETTGVKVAYEPVPLGEDGVTKVNAMLSGGDLPHALMTGMGLFLRLPRSPSTANRACSSPWTSSSTRTLPTSEGGVIASKQHSRSAGV